MESGSLVIVIRGQERFKVVGPPLDTVLSGNAWGGATVVPIERMRFPGNHSIELINKAEALEADVETWVRLVKNGHEKLKNQISDLLASLGPMPPSPGRFWVAALVNPVPALGVAPEIRPRVLRTENDADAIAVATYGVSQSIRHLAPDGRTSISDSWVEKPVGKDPDPDPID